VHLLQVSHCLDTLTLARWVKKTTGHEHLSSLKLGVLHEHATGTGLSNAHDALADVIGNVEVLKWDVLFGHRHEKLQVWARVCEDEELRLALARDAKRAVLRSFFDDSDNDAEYGGDEDDEHIADDVTDWAASDVERCPHVTFTLHHGLRRTDRFATAYGTWKKLWAEGVDGTWESSAEAMLVRQTNLYARLHRAGRIIKRFARYIVCRARGLPCSRYTLVRTHHDRWVLRDDRPSQRPWKPVTKMEMRAFLARRLRQAVMRSRLDRDDLDWQDDTRLRASRITQHLTKTRCEQIKRFLHLADPRSQPPADAETADRLYKVREFMNLLQAKWRHHYTCGPFMCIDESMIDFQGRCRFKTTMAKKHHPNGIKAFVGTDGDSYYVVWVDYKTDKWDRRLTGLFEGTHIAMRMMRETDTLGTQRTLVCDDFYTSPQLFSLLLKHNTHGLGVLRTTRAPARVQCREGEYERGFFKCSYSEAAKMSVYAWQDNRVVYFLTTCGADAHAVLGGGDVDTVQRWDATAGKRRAVPCPRIVKWYCAKMNGIDVTDQDIEYCSMCGGHRRLYKWWKRIFYHLMDLTLHNARILQGQYVRAAGTGRLHSNREFREAVLMGMLEELDHFRRADAVVVVPRGCVARKIAAKTRNGQLGAVTARRACLVCACDPTLRSSQKRCSTECAKCGPLHVALRKGQHDNLTCFQRFHQNPHRYLNAKAARARRRPAQHAVGTVL